MYHFLVGLTFIKSFVPYIRKHMLNVLETHELLFINTIIYTILVSFVFLYKSRSGKHLTNYKKLTFTHICCVVAIAIITIASTLFAYELDKNYNTPFLNSMFKMAASVVLLFFTGVLFFNEKYTIKHILGVAIMIFGVVLTQSEHIPMFN